MTDKFTEKQMQKIIQDIAAPTFKFMMRRVTKNVLDNKDVNKMDVGSFLAMMCATLASIDANALRWLENFHELQTGQKIDFQILKNAHMKNLYGQLGILLQ